MNPCIELIDFICKEAAWWLACCILVFQQNTRQTNYYYVSTGIQIMQQS
jgi:hypothetical protein